MFKRYVVRGVKAGAVAGVVFGLFVAVVANPLIGYAETFEADGHHGDVVPDVVGSLVSIVGGVLYGILLGAFVFGVVFYFLEPTLPGTGRTKRYLLAAAGFLSASGVPWLVVPPVPPGVEQSLPTRIRLALYLAGIVVGAVASGLAVGTYNRLYSDWGRGPAVAGATLPFILVIGYTLVAPQNQVSGPVPTLLANVFVSVTIAGQLVLWLLLATVYTWLGRRDELAPPSQMKSSRHSIE